jgi:hypothetical protein
MAGHKTLDPHEDADLEYERQARLVSYVHDVVIRIDFLEGHGREADHTQRIAAIKSLPNEFQFETYLSVSSATVKTFSGLTLDTAEILAPRIRRMHRKSENGDIVQLPIRVFADRVSDEQFFPSEGEFGIESVFLRIVQKLRTAVNDQSTTYLRLSASIESLCANHIMFRWLGMTRQVDEVEEWLLKLLMRRRFSIREIRAVWSCRNTRHWWKGSGPGAVPCYDSRKAAFRDPAIINALGSNVLRTITGWPGWISDSDGVQAQYLVRLQSWMAVAQRREDLYEFLPDPITSVLAFSLIEPYKTPHHRTAYESLQDTNIETRDTERNDSIQHLPEPSTDKSFETRAWQSTNGKRKQREHDTSEEDMDGRAAVKRERSPSREVAHEDDTSEEDMDGQAAAKRERSPSREVAHEDDTSISLDKE